MQFLEVADVGHPSAVIAGESKSHGRPINGLTAWVFGRDLTDCSELICHTPIDAVEVGDCAHHHPIRRLSMEVRQLESRFRWIRG